MLRRRHVESVTPSPGLGSELVDVGCALAASGGQTVFTVGRNSGNSLSLDHPALPLLISRQHATLTLASDGEILKLSDCGATNGTWVNEVRLPSRGSALLAPGDVVSFGGPGCIMKDGRPFRNPFIYDYCPSAVRDPVGRRQHDAPPAAATVQPESDPDSPAVIHEAPSVRMEDSEGADGEEEPAELLVARARPRAARPSGGASQHELASPGPSRLGPTRLTVHSPSENNTNPPSQRGSPMQSVEPTRRAPRIGHVAALSHDVAQGSPSSSMMVDSPRVRARTSLVDVNPSPSKRGRLQGKSPLSESNENDGKRKPEANTMQALENSLECVVCREWMVGPHSLVPCGHMFCGNCIHEWTMHHPHNPSCPSCRSTISAPPVKCLPVDNIISDIVQGNMSPGHKQEHMKRRKKWEEIAPKAAQTWQNQFGGRPRGVPSHGSHHQAGEGGSMFQGSNFNLNLMLDNLRQVRETLRSVTQAEAGPITTALPSFTVEYARSGRSRCVACQELIAARQLRIGMRASEDPPQGHYTSNRWHHFECFPTEAWQRIDASSVHGMRTVSASDQARVQSRMGRAAT
eukprot:jgi/Tetstr1/454826/TSEL_041706.t1